MTIRDSLQHTSSLKGEYAGFASRFVAFAIDLAIVVVMSGLISWVIIASMSLVGIDLVEPVDEAARNLIRVVTIIGKVTLIIMPVFLLFVYWFIFWMVTGQTVGKRMMGVRVARIDGGRMKASNTLRRIIMYFLGMIPFFLGFFWILIDDERRGWHDKFAGTCVIYAWNAREVDNFMNTMRRHAKRVEQRANQPETITQDSAEP